MREPVQYLCVFILLATIQSLLEAEMLFHHVIFFSSLCVIWFAAAAKPSRVGHIDLYHKLCPSSSTKHLLLLVISVSSRVLEVFPPRLYIIEAPSPSLKFLCVPYFVYICKYHQIIYM